MRKEMGAMFDWLAILGAPLLAFYLLGCSPEPEDIFGDAEVVSSDMGPECHKLLDELGANNEAMERVAFVDDLIERNEVIIAQVLKKRCITEIAGF